MRVLICGDRDYTRPHIVKSVLDGIHREWFQRYFPSSLNAEFTVVEGEARGADTHARQAAKRLGLNVEPYPADWNQFGKAAGAIRNRQMLDSGVDLVLAFHDDLENSKGTKDMTEIAKKAGVPVYNIRRL